MVWLLFAVVGASVSTVVGASVSTVTIQTPSGALRGIVTSNYRMFLGIPYAAPPLGENRWKAPQRLDRWEGVRDALSYSRACTQSLDFTPTITHTSEDCLYLNVYSPPKATQSKIPVMVYIQCVPCVWRGSPTAGTAAAAILAEVRMRHG